MSAGVWSHSPPTAEGWYWERRVITEGEFSKPYPVSAYLHDDELVNSAWSPAFPFSKLQAPLYQWFSEPIIPPADEGADAR